MNNYSKENPSEKYLELVGLYKQLHDEGEKNLDLKAEETFQGISLPPQLSKIKKVIASSGSINLLDYGCGKALAWQEGNYLNIDGVQTHTKDYLGIEEFYLYDAGYKPYSKEPQKKYDIVICTDVLEHISEVDMKWFISELFSYADKFVFANIASYPAGKILPNGENAHCTVKTVDWWKALFEEVAYSYNGVNWEIWVDYIVGGQRKEIMVNSTMLREVSLIGKLDKRVQKSLKKTTSPTTLLSMANLSSNSGAIEESRAYLQKAIKMDKTCISAYIGLSRLYLQENEYIQAQNILRSYPKYTQEHKICEQISKNYTEIGMKYFNAGDYPQAVLHLKASVEYAKEENLGFIYKNISGSMLVLNNNLELIEYARKAYEYEKSDADIVYHIGVYYFREFDYKEANKYLLKAHLMVPTDPFYIIVLAKLEIEIGDVSRAYEYIQKAYKLSPDNIDVLKLHGRASLEMKEYDESLVFYQKALRLNPNDVKALAGLGVLYQVRNELDMAVPQFAKALSINPIDKDTLINTEVLYYKQGKFNESISTLIKAINSCEYDWKLYKHLAIRYLGLFDFEKGWDIYKYREANITKKMQLVPMIDTLEIDLSGKRICVLGEQGLGDELFFLRFISMLKERGAWIAYRPKTPLAKILSSCPDIDAIVKENHLLTDADYTFAVGELPRLLGVNSVDLIPKSLKLYPNKELVSTIEKDLSIFEGSFVGITWRSGVKDDFNSFSKEVPLDEFIDAIKDVNANIVVLQRNPEEEEIQRLKEAFGDKLIDASSYNEDLEKMLALISVLDRYIAVSNTNIYLAAALDKTCHVLLPYPAEWRWGYENRDTSAWFDGFKLYRQESFNSSWKSTLGHLEKDLLAGGTEGSNEQENYNVVIDELIRLERFSEAEDLCDKILSVDKTNIEVLTRYSKVLTLTNQFEKLISTISKMENELGIKQ